MNPLTPAVRRITVARLFNLGNYEHERIEVEVKAIGYETTDGEHVECPIANPAQVLTELRELLEKAKPVEMLWDAQMGFRIDRGEVKIDDSGTADGETVGSQSAQHYLNALQAYRTAVGEQKAAIARLNELGTVRTEGGAK